MISAPLLLVLCQVAPSASPSQVAPQEPAPKQDPPQAEKPAPNIPVGAPLTNAPAATPPRQSSQALNGIQFVVNDQAVTRRDFIIDLQRHNVPNATEQEREAALQQTVLDRVRDILMEQAGRDMGFDQELVKRYVDDSVKDQIESFGGIVDLTTELKRQRLDPGELRALKERTAYRQMWSRSAEGLQPGTSGRVHVDRYVRPGRLWFEYQRTPQSELSPTLADWQNVLISVEGAGGTAEAKSKAEDVAAQARAGADFTTLVQEFSESDTRRNGGWEREAPLSVVLERFPDLGEFIRDAEPKSVSDPIPIRIQGELVAFWVVANVKRTEPKAVAFDGESQEALRKRIQDASAAYHRDQEVAKLFEAAYVWPPELFGGERPGANEARGGRSQAPEQAPPSRP